MNAVQGQSATLPVRVGDVIASKFRIEKPIAEGGDGVVMLATHLQLDERVALKFILAKDPERALTEARVCLRLKTRHVARVMDVGRHGDIPFIVMEHLEGKDLQTMLAESGSLDEVSDAVELVTQVCEAVAEAHRAGIIHRDIKLGNLFLVASRSAVPQVKLLDFGIAAGEGVASTQRTAGTLQYMSPEAIQGVVDDPRVDLWAIGVVLFELLTGVKPFPGQDAVNLIADIFEAEHPALRTLRQDAPEELEKIVDKCLEKDPAFRFQSAGELAEALRPFAPPRAMVSIERAVELSAEGPPSVRMLAASAPPSSSRRSISSRDTTAARSSGSLRLAEGLRASGSQRLRSPTTRSGSGFSVAAPANEAKKRTLLYVIAAVAVIGLITTFVVVRSLDSEAAAQKTGTAATTAAPAAQPPTVASSEPAPPVTAAVTTTTPSAPVTGTAAAAVPVFRGGPYVPPRGGLPPTSGQAAAPKPAPAPAPVTPSAPPAPASTGVDKDPWKASRPKLEDNPFK
ncbi:MAG: serine/threonine-protein kinase [Labilithrix sp.]